MLAPPAVLVALIIAVLLVIIGLPWWLALLLAVGVAALIAFALWHRAPRVALAHLGAVPIDPRDEPRLANVVEGLCATFGHTEPKLHVVASDSANAAIVGHSASDAHLVVTRGLLTALDRLELEAVVARLLSQLRRGVDASATLVSLAMIAAPFGLRDRVLEWALDRRSVLAVDLDAVRMTRYPPALASAYEKAADIRPIESTPVADHLWLLGTTSGRPRGVVHPPISDRIDILREL